MGSEPAVPWGACRHRLPYGRWPGHPIPPPGVRKASRDTDSPWMWKDLGLERLHPLAPPLPSAWAVLKRDCGRAGSFLPYLSCAEPTESRNRSFTDPILLRHPQILESLILRSWGILCCPDALLPAPHFGSPDLSPPLLFVTLQGNETQTDSSFGNSTRYKWGEKPSCTGGKRASGNRQGEGQAALQVPMCRSEEKVSLSVITPGQDTDNFHSFTNISFILFLPGWMHLHPNGDSDVGSDRGGWFSCRRGFASLFPHSQPTGHAFKSPSLGLSLQANKYH